MLSWQGAAKTLQVFLTIIISGLSIGLTYPLSSTAAYIYYACFIFVTFIAPGVLVWAQRYKKCVLVWAVSSWVQQLIDALVSEIRGTWDPAVPKVNRRLSVTR